MPLKTLRAIDAYVSKGGTAIATRRAPSLAPGFKDDETPQIRELSNKLFPTLVDEDKLGGALHRVLQPDLANALGLGFVHRKTAGVEIYFIVNPANRPAEFHPAFRSIPSGAERWNLVTGAWKRSTDSLSLPPYGSVAIVSDPRILPEQTNHRRYRTLDLSSDWTVTIGGVSKKMPKLESWTLDPAFAHFSGEAVYEKTFDARGLRSGELSFGDGAPVAEGSEKRAGSGMRAWIESPVREAAVVYLNGKRAGSVWCPPYSLDVTGLLRGGKNTIRIVVGNLAVNAMAGHPEDFSQLSARFGERFQPQDMDKIQPEPSGLLGPIRLTGR